MAAKEKLNKFYLQISLVVAALSGWVFQSWTLFLVVFLVLVGGHIYTGEIQGPRNRR